MKKILQTVIITALCVSTAALSGCGSNTDTSPDTGLTSITNTEQKFTPISEIRENFPQTAEELRKRGFDNLDFSEAEFSFPDIDSISELSMSMFKINSAREIYDFMCASIETFAPGKFSEEQMLNEIKFYDGEKRDDKFPTINDYTLTQYPYPSFESEDFWLDMQFGAVRWYDNGALKCWSGEEGDLGMRTMYNYGSLTEFITDMNCTDKYELTNGEISIKDAAEFVNEYLASASLSPYELSAETKADGVSVVDIGNGKYGYNFRVSYVYKNVPFDHYDIAGGGGAEIVPNDYDERDYTALPGQVGMIETDKIYQLICPVLDKTLEEKETFTSIISLESAAEKVSEFYSDAMNFSVKSVSAVYLGIDTQTAAPCWKFIMLAGGNKYNTFVNMHTGEIYVYILAR